MFIKQPASSGELKQDILLCISGIAEEILHRVVSSARHKVNECISERDEYYRHLI